MTKKDRQGYALLICVIIFFSTIFYLKHVISAAANAIDPETLCRMDIESSVIKLLIDKTDPWDEYSRKKVATLIRSLKSNLALHERLSIHILDETGTYSPVPIFDMCNPGRNDQANTLYQNPRLIQEKFDEQFAAPLDALLDDLLQPGIASRSPIIETIHGLRNTNRQEKLIIVSDMMQNSAALSLYNNSSEQTEKDIETLCRLKTPYQNITVYFINRLSIDASRKQTMRIFWQSCLNRNAWDVEWHNL